MEQYLFHTLVDMILTAKMNLPPDRPLHLFGAGHPIMFALAVALGCDLFDSAAYAIYAREDRYMTEHGTVKFSRLQRFPCPCPVCAKNDPRDVGSMPRVERQRIIAQHNLHVSFSEIRRIKQAITEGRLWEHLEARAHGHPALLQALKHLKKYSEYLEEQSPVTKRSGLFFFTSLGLIRPEVVRHRKRLFERYAPPEEAEVLLLLPQTQTKPFHKSREHRRALKEIQRKLGDGVRKVHACTYAAPFGVVPLELDEVYPLSQYEIAIPLDAETREYTANQVASYIRAMSYKKAVMLQDAEAWRGKVARACKEACDGKKIPLIVVQAGKPWSKGALTQLATALQEALAQEKTG